MTGFALLAALTVAALAVTLWPAPPARPNHSRETLRLAMWAEAQRLNLSSDLNQALAEEFKRTARDMEAGIISWGHGFIYLQAWIKGRAPRKPSAVDARIDAGNGGAP